MPGVFITFEGIEGSGKSTQMSLLAEHLAEKELGVKVTREPGGTEIGAEIRRILLNKDFSAMDYRTELLLYAADRAQHIAQVVEPALNAGQIVISDRYLDSNIAYQHFGRGLPLDMILSINGRATCELKPAVTFLLDVPVKIGIERATRENTDRIEQESLDFHERVSLGFKELAANEPDRWCVIDGTQTIDDIHNDIIERCREILPDSVI